MNGNTHTMRKPLSPAYPFLLLTLAWALLGGILWATEQDRSVYRYVNAHYSAFLDQVLPYLTHMGEGWIIIPALITIWLAFPAFRNLRFGLSMLLSNIVPFIIVHLIKNGVNAPRPLKYFDEADWIHRVQGQPVNYNYSFPSGHSEGAFAFFCFISLILPPKHKSWSIFFFFLALIVAYSRLYLSQHFLADVYVGSLIGTVSCALIYNAYPARVNRTRP